MEKTSEVAREGSAEVEPSDTHPRPKSPINFTLLLCLLPFCFEATMTGVNIKACWAPLASRPPTARHRQPLMHKHFSAVLPEPLHIKGSRLTTLGLIMTGPFSVDWHAHSLVTCHTPQRLKQDREIVRPHVDWWAAECSRRSRRCVALSDPLLCPIAQCDASTLA